ncbi:MAG: hypothetical protein GXX81_08370 [Acidobacteria bacterium]|nr:hypothetical protein [Acidobacteriota bacterium]
MGGIGDFLLFYCLIPLENLCRYAGRPPVATKRLSQLPDRRVLYQPRQGWREGTS